MTIPTAEHGADHQHEKPSIVLSATDLANMKFRGPVAFYDGANGMARQEFECISEPRFGYAWERKNRDDKGRQFYMIDGAEVSDFEQAAALLAKPADPESPRERMHRSHDEFSFSPKVGGATRALSEARCNGDAGPFGTVRAWMRRADNAWHRGINKFADMERQRKGEWPRWLYNAKSSAHEMYRAIYLFGADRKADDDMRCAFSVRCRDCEILKTIEAEMIAARAGNFPSEADDTDIDAVKAWTCMGHILSRREEIIDGSLFDVKSQRGREF